MAKARFNFKAQDDKLDQIRGVKWGRSYQTTDESVPEIKTYHREIAERFEGGNQGAFMTSPKKPGFKIIFGQKAIAKIPEDFRHANYRTMKKFVVKKPLYNITGRTIFINFFTEIEIEGVK